MPKEEQLDFVKEDIRTKHIKNGDLVLMLNTKPDKSNPSYLLYFNEYKGIQITAFSVLELTPFNCDENLPYNQKWMSFDEFQKSGKTLFSVADEIHSNPHDICKSLENTDKFPNSNFSQYADIFSSWILSNKIKLQRVL